MQFTSPLSNSAARGNRNGRHGEQGEDWRIGGQRGLATLWHSQSMHLGLMRESDMHPIEVSFATCLQSGLISASQAASGWFWCLPLNELSAQALGGGKRERGGEGQHTRKEV